MATTTIQNNDPASNITPAQQKSTGGIISNAQLGASPTAAAAGSADFDYKSLFTPITDDKPASVTSTAASYSPSMLGDPTKLEVTKDQTVAGQMQGLIDPNSPYYQQWQTAGLQAANARGVQNSSIAQTGILDSVMRGATPIATSDASTYAKAAAYNADEQNQFAVANQNAANSAGAFNAGQANSLTSTKYTADKSADTQLAVTDKNNQTALAQSGISADTQKTIASMNNQSQAAVSAAHDANSNLIQSNQQAQAAYNSYVAAVAQIDQNKDMDANAKATAIARQTQIFNSSIAGLKAQLPTTSDIGSPLDPKAPSEAAQQVGGVDVSNLLTFG